MNITIRAIEGQEMLEALYPLAVYSFHSSPPFENKEEWMERASGRRGVTCHAVYEEETPVSIAVSSAMTQNIRGTLYPASGVWGVSTHTSARRKGYCRQAVASVLAAERESGKAFTNLYPFRESFYERLGYVTFPSMKIAKFVPQSLAPLLKWNLEGEIEQSLTGDAYEIYREYLAKMRLRQHGMAFFDFGDQAAANRNNFWLVTARFDGNIEGLMMYRLNGEEITKFTFYVGRFYYQSSRARYLLLEWIARHVDQAERVEMWLPGDETPETWISDLQVRIESPSRAPMGRVLDVARIGGMSVGDGSFAARITDPVCPWNQGTWRFEARDGRLQVSRAAEDDCELSIQGLSALAAGTHDPGDFPLRGWGNPGAAVQAILRNMFPRLCPYIHENF